MQLNDCFGDEVMTDEESMFYGCKSKLAPYLINLEVIIINKLYRSYSPNLYFLCDYTPGGVVVVRGDYMQIFYILFDQLI